MKKTTVKKSYSNTLKDIHEPKVSVIVTSFNYRNYVKDAIRSVQTQHYKNFECLIVDDASTDGSADLIHDELDRLSDRRFELVRLTENVGQAGAFREGLRKASGSFVAFLDADDMWMPDFLQAHVMCHLNTSHSAGFSFSDAIVIGSEGEVLQGTWMDCKKDRPTMLSGDGGEGCIVTTPTDLIRQFDPATDTVEFVEHPSPARWHFAPTSGCVFRRGLLTEIFPETDADKISADYHIEMMASLLTGSLAISKALFFYRLHGENHHASHPVVGGRSIPGPWDQEDTLNRNDQLLEVLQQRYERLSALFGDWTVLSAAKRIALVSRQQRNVFAENQPELYRRVFRVPKWMSPQSSIKLREATRRLPKPFR